MKPSPKKAIIGASADILRASVLKSDYGDPSYQKDQLVNRILGAFESPDKWPMTDGERVSLLKNLWNDARLIRSTEQAIKKAAL